MAKYMLAIHTVEDAAARQPMTEAEMQAGWQKLGEVEEEMKATGAWFFSGLLVVGVVLVRTELKQH